MKIFVPGRLLIIGDHSDWVGKFNRHKPTKCVEALLNRGIYAKIEKSDKFEIYYKKKKIIAYSKSELLRIAESNNFFRYAAGTAANLIINGGIKIVITKSTLPESKGLASSACICVLVAKAYNKIYNLNLTEKMIMEYAYFGESLTGSGCGKGDQISAYSGKLFGIDFLDSSVSPFKINFKGKYYFLIVDLKGNKDTKIICNSLQKNFEKSRKMKKFLEVLNTRLCSATIKGFEINNPELIGACMNKSMELFDKYMVSYCPEQLNSPLLHKLKKDNYISKNSYGVKGVGAQGDGSAQILCKNFFSMLKLKRYIKKIFNMNSEVLRLKQ